MVSKARDVQMFICNHHTSLALFRTFSKKEFLKPVETRYVSYFILLERMLEVQEALQSMVVNAEWTRWHESSTPDGRSVKRQILDDNWWTTMRYIFSFIDPIVQVIRYADTDSPSLGEIYETFDNMLGQIKQVILTKDANLGFYEEHLKPIVMRRWNIMNTPLHMAAYAINPKWYAPRLGRVAPSRDEEVSLKSKILSFTFQFKCEIASCKVDLFNLHYLTFVSFIIYSICLFEIFISSTQVKEGFFKALAKLYNENDDGSLRVQWLDFANLRSLTFGRPKAKTDRATLAQRDPIGWWTWHGRDTPELKILAICLLSQVVSSSAAERNWSTYGFIQLVKRNNHTSTRSEKLVVVHSALWLQDRQSAEYHQTPALRWDVNPKEAMQVKEDDTPPGLLGVPLDEGPLPTPTNDSEADSDFDLDSNS